MLKAKDGDFFVTDWLRNRNTMEFLGVWESVHNPDFNYGEFATIRNQAGLNNFKISVKEFAAKTNDHNDLDDRLSDVSRSRDITQPALECF